MSTYLCIALFLATGFRAAWRSGPFLAGAVAGVATAGIGAVFSMVGAVGVLAIWHDPQTMQAIRASGGLVEVFTLPLLMVVPGAVLGAIGGIAGAAGRRLRG